MNCTICSDTVAPEESYFGMPLHRSCLDAAEARRLAKYGPPGVGPACLQCGRPIGARDYPATYPWDSECECYPESQELPIVKDCPVCGHDHELRICPVNEKSLLFQPCKRCQRVHPFKACNLGDPPATKPRPKSPPAPRQRIAEADAG